VVDGCTISISTIHIRVMWCAVGIVGRTICLRGNCHMMYGLEPWGTVAPREKQNDGKHCSVAAMGQMVDGIGG